MKLSWTYQNKMTQELATSLAKVADSPAGEPADKIVWEHPANENMGDYATSVALSTDNPRQQAEEMVKKWQTAGLPACVDQVEVAGAGFINVWLKQAYLITQLQEVLKLKEKYGRSGFLKDKKVLLEHTSPNPQTTIMLGHLRNNFLGMSVAHLLTNAGAKVTLDCVVNDRGVHICRSMWGYLVFGQKKNGLTKAEVLGFKNLGEEKFASVVGATLAVARSGRAGASPAPTNKLSDWITNPQEWWTPAELNLKPDHANLIWYVLGSRAYKQLPEVKEQVEAMLVAWEKAEPELRHLWRQILAWSAAGYAQTYERVSSHHDYVWRESDHWQEGKELVEMGLKKKVFRAGKVDSQNGHKPVVTDLAKYNLSDTVVIKSDGTALYLTQDLALTRHKVTKFPSDLYIWDIGLEQSLYFQQLFAVANDLGIVDREKLLHLSYALINFKGGGKMATRQGNVAMADEILDLLHQRVLVIMANSNQDLRRGIARNARQSESLAEQVALAGLKYNLLKYSRETTMFFDVNESLSLEGNSGPYLQYTYARTQSVLAKADLKIKNLKFDIDLKLKIKNLKLEEVALLRTLARFPEAVGEATANFAPNLICNYLYDLAQKFNLFYNKCRVLGSDQEEFRLALTAAVGQVLKNGLTLLGIAAPAKM